jgi:hypothetical protein
MNRPWEPTGRLAGLLPALAFAGGGAVLAAHQEASAGAETAYLALLGGWALAGAALLAPRGAWGSSWGPLLASVALWALPAGPPRGAALGAVLVAALLVAGWQRLRDGRLDAASAMGGALAVQALLRAGELLPASLLPPAGGGAAVARLLLPPLLAGLALWRLAQRHPLGTVFAAGMAAAVLADGFTATAALPLLALAAVDEATARAPAPRGAATPGLGGLRLGGLGLGGLALTSLALAGLALAVLRPMAGGLALVAALLAAPARVLPARWAWAAAALPLLLGLATGAAPERLLGAAELLVVLPFAPLLGGAPLSRVLGALLLAAGGSLLLPAPAGLAAAAALLALARPSAGASALERRWLAFLLGAGALLAGYPWLRLRGLDTALGLLGLPAASQGTPALLLAVAAVAAAATLLAASRVFGARPAALALAASLGVAALLALPRPATDVVEANLTAEAPTWEAPLAGPVRRVRVVSTLADAAAVPSGAAVAILTLERDGRPLAAWTLRAGRSTGEWAADRSDLRGRAARGPVWWSWVAPGPGSREAFFAHAYAAAWSLSQPVPATSIRVARASGLAAEVRVALLRVEVTQ